MCSFTTQSNNIDDSLLLIFLLFFQIFALQFAPLQDRECIGDSYCENVRNYPLKTIQNAVSQNIDKFGAFFGTDVIEEKPTSIETMNRNAFGGPEEKNLCESNIVIKFPKKGMTVDGERYYIVNDGLNYTQGIRVELCA